AARFEEPGPPPELPHGGEELVRVAGVLGEVAASRLRVDEEDLLPGGAAVLGLEDAALHALAPLGTRRAHPGHVGRRWVGGDLVDALGLVQPEVFPRLPAVARAVDAVADGRAVARVAFARSHPDDVGVGGGDGDAAD